MEPSAVCALLCEADAARHTHQSWRWAGSPDPRRLPEWIAATLGVFSKRVASFGVEIKPRLTNGHKRAAVAVGSVTTAELSFDRYTCV